MSAVVNGTAWTAATVQATVSNGVVAIAGMDATSTTQIQLRTVGVSSAGTVTIGAGSPHVATLMDNSTLFTASGVIGSGTITFSTLSSDRAEGTFSFTAYTTDQKLSRTVTNGKFSVRF